MLGAVWAFVLLPGWTGGEARAAAGEYAIGFGEHMGAAGGIRFHGETDSAALEFLCEVSAPPGEGSALELVLEHSPSVDPARSYLTLQLNYGILRSLRLDDANQAPTRIQIPVPASLLKPGRNRLEISVRQFAAAGAGESDLWTAAGEDSRLTIRTAPGEVLPALEDLPAPFADPYSYRPQSFEVLLPQDANPATLEALALVVANLCRAAAPAPVDVRAVRRLQDARRPLLAVGTLEEQPELQELAPSGGGAAIVPHPRFAAQPILLIAGAAPGDVRNAARSLRLLADSGAEPPPGLREWPGYAPPRSRFTLADLGFEESGLSASNGYSLAILLRAPPDFRFAGYPAHVRLGLRLTPAARRSEARLRVELNGIPLDEQPLASLGWPVAELKLPFPGDALERENVLRISLAEPPSNPGHTPFLTVLPSSRCYLPHSYEVTLPDLGLLRHGLFPSGMHPDLRSTILLVPPRITPETAAMVIEAAAAIGRLAPSGPLQFRLRTPAELRAAERSRSHFIYLRPGAGDEDPPELFAALPVPPGAPAPRLQQTLSPWNKERTLTLLDAGGAKDAAAFARSMLSAGTLERLSGDAAIAREGGLEFLQLAEPRTFRESFPLRRIESWISSSWYGLPLVVSGLSAVLYLGYLAGIGYYRRTARRG